MLSFFGLIAEIDSTSLQECLLMAHRLLPRCSRVALGAKQTSPSMRHATGFMSTRPKTN
jgi:hypothetical protein